MQRPNDKDGYVIHFDDFDGMDDENLQKFLMYAFKYARDSVEPELEGLEKVVWKHIQKRIDYDNEQWVQTKQQRSNAGKNHKGNQYTRDKLRNGTDLERNGTNGTVYVTDTVNVSVSDNVNELNECAARAPSKSNKRPFVSEKNKIPTPQQVFEFYRVMKLLVPPERFYNYNSKRNWRDERGNPIENWAGAYMAMNASNPDKYEKHNPDLEFDRDCFKDFVFERLRE